jgi:hypothetical protein
VGAHSFETLDKIYTGYDEKGPAQGVLIKEGMSERLRAEFKKLDFVKSCHIVDREVQDEPWDAQPVIKHVMGVTLRRNA